MIVPIISIILISSLITFAVTPFVILLAKKYNLLDNPKTRTHPAHTHKGIIPRAGGVSVFIGIFLPVFLFLPVTKITIGIFLGAFTLILLGLWDDIRDRSPYIRIVINCLSAILVIGTGVGIPYITNPIGGIIHFNQFTFNFDFLGNSTILILADIIALLWIVWTTNIIGWSGGIDGQLPGFVSISAFIIGILSLRFIPDDPKQWYVTFLSFATAGAFLGFLPWNFYPQKIMPGYGGKTLAGFMLAILSILSYSKLGTAMLVLIVPMTDAFFVFIRRIISGKSPVRASSGHLHHHLLALGWGRRKIAIFYWTISACTGIVALVLNSKQKIFAGVLMLVTVSMFIIWIYFMRKFSEKKDGDNY